MKQSLLKHFGLDQRGRWDSQVRKSYVNDIRSEIESQGMTAIVGPAGAGKTELMRDALNRGCWKGPLSEDIEPRIVRVRNFYKEHLNIGSIINAILYDVAGQDVKIRRDLEARSRDLRRILGQFVVDPRSRAIDKPVVVVIEEAHRVHHATWRAVKELREMEWLGVSPLFSVVLIGHEDLKSKLSRWKEVNLRTTLIDLTEDSVWMSLAERTDYLKQVYGEALTLNARSRIAAMGKTPLELDRIVETRMQDSVSLGLKQVTPEVVAPSRSDRREMLDLSFKDIADRSGLSKSTVYSVFHGTNKIASNLEAVDRVLDEIEQEEQHEQLAAARAV